MFLLAKLLSKLQQYRSVRATNERLELAGLIRRSRELEKEISSEQEKNEQLEKEIEYEKNLLRVCTSKETSAAIMIISSER